MGPYVAWNATKSGVGTPSTDFVVSVVLLPWFVTTPQYTKPNKYTQKTV